MKESESVITVRLADGEEFCHHGEIADQLFNNYVKGKHDHVRAIFGGGAVIYSRIYIASVVYSELGVREEHCYVQ